jgi:hypothetical protein
MTHLIGKILTEKGKHRLHDRLNNLLIVISSVGIASTYVVEGKVDLTTISFVTLECHQYPTEIRIPFVGPLEIALKNLEPDGIEIDFVAKTTPTKTFAVKSSGFKKVIGSVIGSLLSDFYEANKDWLKGNVSTDPYNWPPVWNFARIVRNAVAHDGAIYFKSPTAAPVKWYNLQYSPADNTKSVLYMSAGDLIALMFEMSNELEKLKAPII